MKLFFFASLCLCISACTKEENTYSKTTFVNSTNHTISVTPFFNGSVNSSGVFKLMPNESKIVDDSYNRGLGDGISYGYLSSPNDSILVIFNNTSSIVHYRPTFIGPNSKRYLFTSKRNIYNDSSYVVALTQNEKYTRSWSFTYTFKEQDYLDAK